MSEEENPFSPENIGVITFVLLGRIYDVLMADLQVKSPEVAQALMEVHMRGDLAGPPPDFSGVFLSGRE